MIIGALGIGATHCWISVGFGATGVVLLLCTLQAVVLQYLPLEDGIDKVPIGNHHYILWKLLLGAMTPLQKASNLFTRRGGFGYSHQRRFLGYLTGRASPFLTTVLGSRYSYYKPEIECSQEGKMLLSRPRDSPSPMLSAVAGSDTSPDPAGVNNKLIMPDHFKGALEYHHQRCYPRRRMQVMTGELAGV